MESFRVCLVDTHDSSYKYLYCKNCHNIVTVTPPKMAFTKLEGDLENVIVLDTKASVNLACTCKRSSPYFEIHADTINAHKMCADVGIDIYYDYGEIMPYNESAITRTFTGDLPIFKFPSLEIIAIKSDNAMKRLLEIIVEYKDRLTIKHTPGYCGSRAYTTFKSIIHTDGAIDIDELCSKEYFDKMNDDINSSRTYIEEIINELIKASNIG